MSLKWPIIIINNNNNKLLYIYKLTITYKKKLSIMNQK